MCMFFKCLFASHLLMSNWQMQVTGPKSNGRKFKEIVAFLFFSLANLLQSFQVHKKISSYYGSRLDGHDFILQIRSNCRWGFTLQVQRFLIWKPINKKDKLSPSPLPTYKYLPSMWYRERMSQTNTLIYREEAKRSHWVIAILKFN